MMSIFNKTLYCAIAFCACYQLYADDGQIQIVESQASPGSKPIGDAPHVDPFQQAISPEDFARYSTLGFPFTERRLYSSANALEPVAIQLLSILPEDENDREQVKAAIKLIRDVLEKCRSGNPIPWAMQNIIALQNSVSDMDVSLLVADLYAAEKLNVVSPIDVLIEYCRICVDVNNLYPMGGIGGFGQPVAESQYSDFEQLMVYPAAATIIHGGDKSIVELERLIQDDRTDPGIQLQALAFMKEISPVSVENFCTREDVNLAPELKTELGILMDAEYGFGWKDVAGGIGSLRDRVEKINKLK